MLQRNLAYPLAILILVFLTVITVLLVLQNTVELLIGIKALPVGTMVSDEMINKLFQVIKYNLFNTFTVK